MTGSNDPLMYTVYLRPTKTLAMPLDAELRPEVPGSRISGLFQRTDGLVDVTLDFDFHTVTPELTRRTEAEAWQTDWHERFGHVQAARVTFVARQSWLESGQPFPGHSSDAH